MKKTNDKDKEQPKICTNCGHCVYICEGDFICDKDEPILVMSDFTPTNDFYYCNGTNWKSE